MKRNNILTILITAILIIVGLIIFSRHQKISPINTSSNELKTHTSQDLKISFKYPRGWYVDEKDRSILLASYITLIGQNSKPSKNQIKMFIDEASLCQDTIEKNLIYGGCGENQKVLNKILNKQTQNLPAGIFSGYTVQYPDNSQNTIYYLQQGDKILQLSKQPDPSNFEKEFKEIVNSITFL